VHAWRLPQLAAVSASLSSTGQSAAAAAALSLVGMPGHAAAVMALDYCSETHQLASASEVRCDRGLCHRGIFVLMPTARTRCSLIRLSTGFYSHVYSSSTECFVDLHRQCHWRMYILQHVTLSQPWLDVNISNPPACHGSCPSLPQLFMFVVISWLFMFHVCRTARCVFGTAAATAASALSTQTQPLPKMHQARSYPWTNPGCCSSVPSHLETAACGLM
jgi:hypothetical protein